MMEQKVKKTIKNNNLINTGEAVIVGVSGGADSMALLHILLKMREEYNLKIIAAHINHGLREEAAKEAEYVREYCNKYGVKFCLKEVNIREVSEKDGLTEEQAGRNIRYDFFSRLSKEYNADKIATAHHKNDNAETVMMHIIRGAGINGIKGIEYKRENIIRPLLDVTRSEIEEYCVNNNILYCSDKTNFCTDYTRNKIRLLTIPHIEKEYNKSFVDALTHLSVSAKEDDDFLEEFAVREYNEKVKDGNVSIDELNKLFPAVKRRIIRMMIEKASGKREDISYAHIDSIMKLTQSSNTGKSINLPENVKAYTEYGKLCVEKNADCVPYEYKLRLNEKQYIKEADIYITMTEADGKETFKLPDYENVKVTVRRNGDVFYPKGMTGKKKLKDYFIDIKLPRSKRDLIPILRYNDEILCVGEKRYDRRRLGVGKGIIFKFEQAF